MKKYIVILLILFVLFFVNSTIVYAIGDAPSAPNIDFTNEVRTCGELLGPNGVKLIKFAINSIRLIAAIIAIVNGMMIMIPPITSKDYSSLQKAAKKLVFMLIILLAILMLPTIIRIIGRVFEYDLSCIF